MKIFINPGHGGSDPGACGNGLREADVCLKIGKRIENYLRAVGYDVKLFQYDGLQEICDDANAWKADLFVSIHCNAATGNAPPKLIVAEARPKAGNSPKKFTLKSQARSQSSIAASRKRALLF